MASNGTPAQYIQLAKTLPPRLLRFLARYPPAAIRPAGAAQTGYQQDTANPFHTKKHEVTGKWHDPIYSLRRQADLVKMAQLNGLQELMPESVKSPEARLTKRVAEGLRVKGTGVGQRVKGHYHERHLVAKMEERRQAMLNMPKLIREWKRVGRRNWTRFPN